MTENPEQYPSVLEAIIRVLRDRGPIPLRASAVWKPELTSEIQALTPTALDVFENEFYHCLRSGLHLWNDDLDRAHTIAQSIPSATGSLCHGIMHRRQGDFGNSKYWFQHVGDHPIFRPLLEEAKTVVAGRAEDPLAGSLSRSDKWDPDGFVDACRERGEDDLLKAIQISEIDLLVRFCFRQAGG